MLLRSECKSRIKLYPLFYKQQFGPGARTIPIQALAEFLRAETALIKL
jgi:hypothetical protein